MTGGTGLVGKGIEWVVENKPAVVGDAKFIFLSSKDADLRDEAQTLECFKKHQPTHVIHLAARVVKNSTPPSWPGVPHMFFGTFLFHKEYTLTHFPRDSCKHSRLRPGASTFMPTHYAKHPNLALKAAFGAGTQQTML